MRTFRSFCPRVYPGKTDKLSRAWQEAKAHYVSQEQEPSEEVYLYQVKEGKSQNKTVALTINGIPISLHLHRQADVTVATEQHCGKLQDKCTAS